MVLTKTTATATVVFVTTTLLSLTILPSFATTLSPWTLPTRNRTAVTDSILLNLTTATTPIRNKNGSSMDSLILLQTNKSLATNTTNTTQIEPIQHGRRPGFTYNQRKLCIALFSLVAIVGVLGNSLVVYVYGFSARKRFLKFERLMLILGVVDLLASVTNPSFFIYQIVYQYHFAPKWHFGEIGCKLIPGFGPISTSISLGIILIMSIDRDRAVVTPFKKQFTTKIIYKAIAVTVVVSLVVFSPYMHYQKLYPGGQCSANYMLFRQYLTYGVSLFLINDILFLLILSVTTVRVFVKLSTASVLSYPKSKEFRARETKRILRIITAMGVTFIVLIYPRDLMQVVFMYTALNPPLVSLPNHLFVNAMLKVLHTSNSSINVFLYSIVNRRFRKEVLGLCMKSKYFRKLSGYQINSDSSTTFETTFRNTTRNEPKSNYRKSLRDNSRKGSPTRSENSKLASRNGSTNDSKVNKVSKSVGKLPAERTPLKTPTAESLRMGATENFLQE